jgi:hypothetical protein
VFIPTLPLDNVALVTVVGKRTKRIKKRALLEIYISEDKFERVFLISPRLISSGILGFLFSREYGITIDSVTKGFYYEKDGSRRGLSLDQSSVFLDARSNKQESKGDSSHSCCVTHDLHKPTARNGRLPTLHSAVRPRCDATHMEASGGYLLGRQLCFVFWYRVGHRSLLNVAVCNQVLLVGGVHEGKCPREIHSSQIEGLREDGATGFKEVNVGRLQPHSGSNGETLPPGFTLAEGGGLVRSGQYK